MPHNSHSLLSTFQTAASTTVSPTPASRKFTYTRGLNIEIVCCGFMHTIRECVRPPTHYICHSHTRARACTHAHTTTHVHTHTYINIHKRAYGPTPIHKRRHARRHPRTHARTHARIYTRARMHYKTPFGLVCVDFPAKMVVKLLF